MATRLHKQAVQERIERERVFAVLRLARTERIHEVVRALIQGGITTIELTLNSRNAFDVLHDLTHTYADCLFGAGTVIGVEPATRAIECGAQFLVSPVVDLDMLAVAEQVGVLSMAGALTPTEAWQAAQAGADLVKLFPMTGLGPAYLKALRGPLPEIRYVVTNGATPANVGEYLAAGAVAVGLGSSLVTDEDIEHARYDLITARATEAIKHAKG